jgi:hypothetical protein
MANSPKTIVITASDAFYAPLVNDLFHSIRSLKFAAPFDLGLLDVGLGDKRPYFEQQELKLAMAEVDIDFPNRAHWESLRPGLRALTASPYLRRYFPGYDLYIWIDADIWVQTPEAIDTLITSAGQSPAMFIASEFDRCYPAYFQGAEVWHKFVSWYQANFVHEIVAAMTLKPMLNVGFFGLSKDSPVWDAWGQLYAEALTRTSDLNEKSFMAHQLALNVALYVKNIPYVVLPASFNWLTYFALPQFDPATGMYVEPLPPHHPISQIHLTRANKTGVEKIQCLDGTVIERQLTFDARKN